LNKINEICARMVTDPGDDMKKAQVVKGVIDDFYSFAAQETRKVSSWSDFCASIIVLAKLCEVLQIHITLFPCTVSWEFNTGQEIMFATPPFMYDPPSLNTQKHP
jgi:hypothetical protein